MCGNGHVSEVRENDLSVVGGFLEEDAEVDVDDTDGFATGVVV